MDKEKYNSNLAQKELQALAWTHWFYSPSTIYEQTAISQCTIRILL
jgi:hypothetical protein